MAWPDDGVPVYTWANKPTASSYIGTVFVGDIGGGTYWVSNGVRWKPLNGRCVLYSINAPTTAITMDGTPKILATTPLLPAGLFQIGDVIEVDTTLVKGNGTAATMNPALYFSTSTSVVGTRSNTSFYQPLTGTAVKSSAVFRYRKKSASILELITLPNGSVGNSSTVATIDDNIVISTDAPFAIQSVGSASVVLTETLSVITFTVSLISDIG